VDLAALAPDAAESERVIGAVLAGLAARPQRKPAKTDVLEIIGRHLDPVWIAAAVAIAIAGSAAVLSRTPGEPATSVGSADALISTWADGQHVPTNAELLLAFQGYGQ
jgi:hypothetical protein